MSTGRPSSRQHFSEATKRTLVDVAQDLFTEHGYAATSLDAVVARAQVTKGALYHHFPGKQALFEAVFVQVETAAALSIHEVLLGRDDAWARAVGGLEAFLEVVRQPAYRRIVIQEGPAVLGYERFREHEELSSYAHVREIVRDVVAATDWQLDAPMVDTFSRIFFGALSSAGTSVSESEDPDAAAERVATAIGFILDGMRSLVEAASRPPTSSR
jgi:AcrR family transcriptional regulator